MSEERETLITDLSINAVDGFFYITRKLQAEIRELLAQPEQDLEVLKKDWVNFGYEAGRKSALSKQEPLTPRQGLEEYKRGYAQAELDLKREPLSDGEITTNTPKTIPIGERLAFHAGIRWAEHQHGIGGGE